MRLIYIYRYFCTSCTSHISSATGFVALVTAEPYIRVREAFHVRARSFTWLKLRPCDLRRDIHLYKAISSRSPHVLIHMSQSHAKIKGLHRIIQFLSRQRNDNGFIDLVTIENRREVPQFYIHAIKYYPIFPLF